MKAHPDPLTVLRSAAPGGLLRVNRAFQAALDLGAPGGRPGLCRPRATRGRAQSTAPDVQRPALTVSASRTDTLHAMAKIVQAKNPGMRCSILLVDAAGECVTAGAGPSLPAEYNEAVEGLHIGPGVGSCGTAAFWNVPIVVEDIDAAA